VRYTH